ncbi:caspase family protein [Variovorax sp. J22R115]|uniref:caspase family protein n=1 Tax=Variovorax sp. J22R115 TaxID=3053509 RepID=UPI0025762C2F|nr:caspase family protein [Variovorax sp. J22R115]MDM0053041.1 caspase family protein [Variovorax sp. J22R115]
MHTAAIGQMRADEPRNRVVTISSDRTVRIWQLPSLRLIRVLRLPQEGSIEGLPAGLAISPDGRTIAVGGWTGVTWAKTASIYLYDSATGRMIRRIDGLADVISALDWSPDGRFLAVGMGGRSGVKVLDTGSWQPIAHDDQYQDSVSFLHFSAQGWLAASAADGAVRLYDTRHALVSRQSVGISTLLGGVRFSPDGKLLALGIIDKPIAVVLKVPTLELATLRQVPDAQQKGLCCIAWARDGSALFVNGEYEGSGPTPLYRFGNRGLGAPQTLPVGNQRFTNMLPVADGGMLFATSTPSLTLIDARSKVVSTLGTVVGDFRDGQQKLLVSADARGISMPMARFGEQPRSFLVSDLELPPLKASLLSPRTADTRFALEGFTPGAASGKAARVNGKALQIHHGDQVNAHAISHDGSNLFVGTTWHLLKLNRDANVIWRQNFSSEVRAVNASANGKWVVITLADGTARWLRQSDGQEVLAFFPHNNDRDWLAWRPDGYYASSEEGDQFVGWHVNRGLDQEPDFYRAVQFERTFYRPDLLRSALDDAQKTTAKGASALEQELQRIAPARLTIEDTQTRINAKGRVEISVKITAQSRTLPMQQLSVYVNGISVTPTNQRALAGDARMRFERTLTVESDRAQNAIRVEVDHGQSLGLVEAFADFAGEVPKQPAPRGRLIVLAIGINKFVNIAEREMDLEFAAEDARDFSEALQRSAQGLFSSVKAVLLNDFTDVKPDQVEIRKALPVLQDAGPDDTVILFLASHGYSDGAGNYYFMTRDGRLEDARRVANSPNIANNVASLMEGSEFFEALRKTAGRRIVVVDTCRARGIQGTLDTHSLRKRSAASSFAFLVAAKGNEESQEYKKGGHGLFTYALLESLKPPADANRDGVVSLSEAFAHLEPIVQQFRLPQKMQTPQLIAPDALVGQPLASVARTPK